MKKGHFIIKGTVAISHTRPEHRFDETLDTVQKVVVTDTKEYTIDVSININDLPDFVEALFGGRI